MYTSINRREIEFIDWSSERGKLECCFFPRNFGKASPMAFVNVGSFTSIIWTHEVSKFIKLDVMNRALIFHLSYFSVKSLEIY